MSKHIKHTERVFHSTSPEETKQAAASIMELALHKKNKKALVFGLEGELGAGKTHFAQGVGAYFGIERNITSPTFVLMKRYKIERPNQAQFYHLDCYRVHSEEEIADLGWEDIISDPGNVVLVEWPERISGIVPKDAIWIKFENEGEDLRSLTVAMVK